MCKIYILLQFSLPPCTPLQGPKEEKARRDVISTVRMYRFVHADLGLTKSNPVISATRHLRHGTRCIIQGSQLCLRFDYNSSIVTWLRAAGIISNGTKMSARGN